jgi:colanic acid biosynthesis glycosyl transferase WcaI
MVEDRERRAALRILILSIYYDPEPIPKAAELARELMRRGHQVTVVTAFPHYPSGSLYPGYTLGLWKRELRDGVPVLRTFIYPYHGTSAALRMVNYVTWMFSTMLAAFLTPKCDVMYVWHPPLTVGVSAWVIGKLKRIPYVYDNQDLWPESALASGLMQPGRVVDFLYRLADWVYARAPKILVVSHGAAKHLEARGVPPEKLGVAPHWIETQAFQEGGSRDVRRELGLEDRFVVMFAGNLGMVQGLETIIEAAALVPAERGIEFVMVGDGSDRARLEALAQSLKVTNVRFVGRHPAEAMPDFLRAADALVVHLRPSEVADHAVPTKVLAYLASGRPIICATGPAAAEVVTAAGAGIVVPPGRPDALADAAVTLAVTPAAERARMGEAGRRHLAAHFDKMRIIDQYEGVLRELARTGR